MIPFVFRDCTTKCSSAKPDKINEHKLEKKRKLNKKTYHISPSRNAFGIVLRISIGRGMIIALLEYLSLIKQSLGKTTELDTISSALDSNML
jgi:hypothetical protein